MKENILHCKFTERTRKFVQYPQIRHSLFLHSNFISKSTTRIDSDPSTPEFQNNHQNNRNYRTVNVVLIFYSQFFIANHSSS